MSNNKIKLTIFVNMNVYYEKIEMLHAYTRTGFVFYDFFYDFHGKILQYFRYVSWNYQKSAPIYTYKLEFISKILEISCEISCSL